MPFVNLIQEQKLAELRAEKRMRAFFGAFAGVTVVSGAVFMFLLIDTTLAASEAGRLKHEIARLKPLQDQIDSDTAEYEKLNPRVTQLQKSTEISNRWERILTHLSKQTPDHTWLKTVRCSAFDASKPISIQITGYGMDQSPIGEFMMRLQNCPDLEDVNLKYTNATTVGTSTAIEFQVESNLAGSIEKKETVKKEAGS